MKSILIRDTTREEREQIVRRSLWGDCGIECEFCSGCDNRGGGTIYSLYKLYIDGEKRNQRDKCRVSCTICTLTIEMKGYKFISMNAALK